MNPSKPRKRCAALLLILLTGVSCATMRQSGQSSLRQQGAHQQTVESSQSDSLASNRHQQIQRSDSSSYTLLVSTETIPREQVQLAIPIRELKRLPPGASFHSRSGRTSIDARMQGDTLILSAESDSIARTRYRFENRMARQDLLSDSSTHQGIFFRNESLLRQDSICQQASFAEREFRKRSAVRWFIVIPAIITVILLLSQTSLPRRLLNLVKRVL